MLCCTTSFLAVEVDLSSCESPMATLPIRFLTLSLFSISYRFTRSAYQNSSDIRFTTQARLKMLPVDEGVNAVDPPSCAFGARSLGKLEAGLDILWSQQWLLPQLSEIDVAIVESPEYATAGRLGFCCLLQVMDSDGALAVRCDDHLVQLLLQEVNLGCGKRARAPLLFDGLLQAEKRVTEDVSLPSRLPMLEGFLPCAYHFLANLRSSSDIFVHPASSIVRCNEYIRDTSCLP